MSGPLICTFNRFLEEPLDLWYFSRHIPKGCFYIQHYKYYNDRFKITVNENPEIEGIFIKKPVRVPHESTRYMLLLEVCINKIVYHDVIDLGKVFYCMYYIHGPLNRDTNLLLMTRMKKCAVVYTDKSRHNFSVENLALWVPDVETMDRIEALTNDNCFVENLRMKLKPFTGQSIIEYTNISEMEKGIINLLPLKAFGGNFTLFSPRLIKIISEGFDGGFAIHRIRESLKNNKAPLELTYFFYAYDFYNPYMQDRRDGGVDKREFFTILAFDYLSCFINFKTLAELPMFNKYSLPYLVKCLNGNKHKTAHAVAYTLIKKYREIGPYQYRCESMLKEYKNKAKFAEVFKVIE